jgi:L-tartrate/succinate antiporter
VPLLAWLLCTPDLKASPEVPAWAARELAELGPPAARELSFAALVCGALAAWIFGAAFVHPTGVALGVMALMLALRVVSWEEMAGHAPAWDMLLRLALLLTLADGLSRTGFVGWAAGAAGHGLRGLSPSAAATGLVAVYFLSHYLFATTTAHAVAVYPVMLSVGLAIPGVPVAAFATVLALSHGIMGVLSPYATGPAPVYHGSGYLPSGLFWRLGAAFGAVFLASLLLLAWPAALALWR